ncbi:MAG: response regulator [Desulfobacterales bacterium]|nr:response regulator [Desulfobacterales bacterium]
MSNDEINNDSPKQSILIVDDSPANIKVLAATLMSDYEIAATTNGYEAIEIATMRIGLNTAPDLILLDIMMPGMDGYEVCRRLKADSRTKNIPVIFITARTEEKEEAKGFELGAVDYITKPFRPAIVKARVNTQLDLKRHRDHLEKLNTLLKEEIAERKRSEAALKELFKKQEVDIELAKKTLKLVNGVVPRYTDISDGLALFADVISVACYAEGGDHFFVRNMKHNRSGKTVFSLKDQSGHEVSCVLRSIITDYIHNKILNSNSLASLEKAVSILNDEICGSGIFNLEDFFTSINAEIDHETLKMRYVSAGHPPFLLIRETSVMGLPNSGDSGTNMPIAIKGGILFSAGEFQLKESDKLIFYTDGLTEMPLKNKRKMITLDELKKITEGIIGQHKNTCSESHAYEKDMFRSESDLPVSDIMNCLLNVVSKMSDEVIIPADYRTKATNTSGDDITILCMELEKEKKTYSEVVWKPKDCDEISVLISDLCDKIEYEWNHLGYESPEKHLCLVLEEAVINAWEHGNKQEPDKSITIRWQFGNDFHLEVIDEGRGFDYKCVPDPTCNENLTKPFGRGIFIIRHFTDFVKWKKGGKHLVMYFKKTRIMN